MNKSLYANPMLCNMPLISPSIHRSYHINLLDHWVYQVPVPSPTTWLKLRNARPANAAQQPAEGWPGGFWRTSCESSIAMVAEV